MKRFVLASLCGVTATGLAVLTPQTADACGGLFCDGGPNQMPVDQTGEHVIFVPTPNSLEVQINILYEGEAENFAWLIPVQRLPDDFKVGSQQLFANVMTASVPQYTFTYQPDDCSFNGDEGGLSAGDPGEGDTGAGGTSGADGDDGGGPEVVHEEEVGTFEITVIEGGTAPEVMTWLADNGYDQGEGAEEIIAEYLAEDFAFMAVKLSADADVDEIHPIALIFDAATEACVPLKLTRIAAVDDMEVRTYFLGQKRTVPQNYKHVLVNPLKIDWMNQGDNYTEVIQRAVDADVANGRAWVTEYAGPSDIIQTTGLTFPQYNPAAFVDGDAADAVNALKDQGLIACGWNPNIDDDDCIGFNPLVLPLLTAYVPAGVEPRLFFLDPLAYRDQLDPAAFDGQELAGLLDERVIEPGKHAEQVLAASAYLSRMYTLISPHEMTEDPMFWHNDTLEDVPNVRSATRRVLCNGDELWILPDGREVYLPAGTTEWPDITGEEYWEEEVADTPENGAPIVLVDNSAAIDQKLAAYNAAQGWDGTSETPGESGESSGDPDADGDDSGSGCGCDVGSPLPGALWAMSFMFGFGVLARRRRR